MAAKYILQAGVTPCDYWTEKGKIEINQNISQENLAYLHSLNYDGIVKVELPEKPKK